MAAKEGHFLSRLSGCPKSAHFHPLYPKDPSRLYMHDNSHRYIQTMSPRDFTGGKRNNQSAELVSYDALQNLIWQYDTELNDISKSREIEDEETALMVSEAISKHDAEYHQNIEELSEKHRRLSEIRMKRREELDDIIHTITELDLEIEGVLKAQVEANTDLNRQKCEEKEAFDRFQRHLITERAAEDLERSTTLIRGIVRGTLSFE